jgi:hypothetical protein
VIEWLRAQLFARTSRFRSHSPQIQTPKKTMGLSIECSDQPLDAVFHPTNPSILAAGLVDGTVEGE